jgi:DNA repair protein RecN (Recombination protein N)
MLRELRIRNLAVIETLAVPFEPGLNVLTGETGAGKSILVDAILLVRGARAQADAIRTDAESALVEAVFDTTSNAALRALLEGVGLASGEPDVVVRRELSRTGRHRAFVNDSPVTIALLERLGDCLVDVHGQHEHQRLLEPARQLDLLDDFANAEGLRARTADLFAKYHEAQAALERTRSQEREGAQREDLLRFQVAELAAARIQPGEEEALRSERRRLQHAGRLAAGLAEVDSLLGDDRDAAASRLDRAARILRDLGRIDPAIAEPLPLLETAAVHVEEVLAVLRRLRDGLEAEPGRLEALDERLDALSRLKRKYGDTEEAMVAFHEAAGAELERLSRHEEILTEETRRVAELEAEVAAAAEALSSARTAAAARLAAAVQREVRVLGMERAYVEIGVERLGVSQMGARGHDRVEFRLSANPGEDARPLTRIASGGELSRTMLAVQAVLAARDGLPTMIFDEVDAGIGGRTAAVVADRLAAAARGRQVLCVTHLAPVAARADHHLLVSKHVRAGRTRATVRALAGAERVEEIARMLGGQAVTEAARRHARELLAARQ